MERNYPPSDNPEVNRILADALGSHANDPTWQQSRAGIQRMFSNAEQAIFNGNSRLAHNNNIVTYFHSHIEPQISRNYRNREGIAASAQLTEEQRGVLDGELRQAFGTFERDFLVSSFQGHRRERPIPLDGMFQSVVGGGVTGLFNGGNVVGGLISGLTGGITNLIFQIPVVGHFVRTASNYVGAWFGSLVDHTKPAISWGEASQHAAAQTEADNIGNALRQFGGLDVAAVQSQLVHQMTYTSEPGSQNNGNTSQQGNNNSGQDNNSNAPRISGAVIPTVTAPGTTPQNGITPDPNAPLVNPLPGAPIPSTGTSPRR